MSATELIRQVAALSPQEKALFIELVQALENGAPASAPLQGQNWPDFNHRLRLIYGDGVAVPGLDLAADPANLGGMTIQTSA